MPQGDWRGESAAVLDRLVDGHEPTRVLVPAGERGRFEDAPLACYWAISLDGVEMGLGETIETADSYIFKLKTVEGWPATLTVKRAPAPGDPGAPGHPENPGDRVYEATATVGRFPDLPKRRARARKLLDAFDEFMTALGKKKKLGERSELQ